MDEKAIHRGILSVSAALLEEALRFPSDHHIIAIEKDWRKHSNVYELIVEGPEMPEVREGEIMPEVYGEIRPMKFRW